MPVTTDELRAALIAGGDERVALDPVSNLNRYHLDPADHEGLFSRGSCTANALTPSGHAVATGFLERRPDADLTSVLDDHERRLRHVVGAGCDEPFEVFWGPSGSDLMYLPLLFQRLLGPDRRIRNVVSCPEELGSGSLIAADGRYFSARTQSGPTPGVGEPLGDLGPLEVATLPARDHGGNIVKRRDDVGALLGDGAGRSGSIARIGNLVFGSKSGIEDDLDVIDAGGDDVMWVVDLCQFRVDTALIATLLEAGVLLMLTGSKYFESPPFCAAMLVPDRWAAPLRELSSAPAARVFRPVVAAEDVPASCAAIRDELAPVQNWGLRLRWEVALAEMEAHDRLDPSDTEDAIAGWNGEVCALLESSPSFDLIPDQHMTNSSIVSFQVLVDGRPLAHEELTRLFATVVRDRHDGFSDGCDRVFFGQPVRYSHGSFIRLALGSHSVRARVEGAGVHDDARLLEVIEATARSCFA